MKENEIIWELIGFPFVGVFVFQTKKSIFQKFLSKLFRKRFLELTDKQGKIFQSFWVMISQSNFITIYFKFVLIVKLIEMTKILQRKLNKLNS